MDREREIFDTFFAPCPHFDSVEGKCVDCLVKKRDLRCPECYEYLNIYGLYGLQFRTWCQCYTGNQLRRIINGERERRVLEESRARRAAEGRATAGDLNASAPKAVSTEDKAVGDKPRKLRADVHELHQRIRDYRDAIRRLEGEIEALGQPPRIDLWAGRDWF